MEVCPICSQKLFPFRAKMVCRTPGCGFMENCCDGGWMARGGKRSTCEANEAGRSTVEPSQLLFLPDDCRRR